VATTDADIRDFQQDLRACTEGALTGSEDAAYSEAKFLQVRALIERFRGREGSSDSDRRWTRTEDDALALIGKRRQSEIFDRLVQATRVAIPALVPWIAKRPMALLEHADDWERILAVVSWFSTHPRSGLYARQIDVPGVHSKFIESRRLSSRTPAPSSWTAKPCSPTNRYGSTNPTPATKISPG
jgi:hypothetical protein